MCIIAISPKGTDKLSPFFEQALRTSALRNRDGMGFAFKQAHNQALYYHKGFTNVETMIGRIEDMKIKREDELIVHFRIKTQGIVCPENCHPFVLSSDEKSIDSVGPSTTIFPLMFHNGHFTGFESTGNHSDTYNFAREVMRIKDIYTLLKIDKNKFMQLFGNIIDYNKMALLYPKTSAPLVTVGSFVEDEGYLFSNHTYKDNSIGARVKKALDNTGDYIIKQFETPKKKARFDRTMKEALIERKIRMFEKESHYNSLDGIITFDPECFEEVVFKAKHNIIGMGIEKNDRFLMLDYTHSNKHHCIQNMADNTIAWIKNEDIEEDFDLIPKLPYKDKYQGYFRLSGIIDPSRSQIKKLARTYERNVKYKKALRPGDHKINLKYNNRVIDNVRLDSLKMFLKDHEHYIENSVLI